MRVNMYSVLAILVLAHIACGAFPLSAAPGVYSIRQGESKCPSQIRVDRSAKFEYFVNGSRLSCGVKRAWAVSAWDEAEGNEMSNFLRMNVSHSSDRVRSRVGSFIIARLQENLECTREGETAVVFRAEKGTVVNFFTPVRTALVNFTAMFGKSVPIGVAPLPGGARLLTFGGSCLYARTKAGDCFPADTVVVLKGGRRIRMNELMVGDEVLVRQSQGKAVYSSVFMWTHRDHTAVLHALKLELGGGRAVTLSHGHLLYANGRAMPADMARVGDLLELGDGESARIRNILVVKGVGSFNPQTIHGDIVVDGVRASTFTSTVDRNAAHALLVPFRAAHRASIATYVRKNDVIARIARSILS